MKAKARGVATSTSTRRPLVALGLSALLCCLALVLTGGAQATKGVYFSFGSGGTLGGQFNTSVLGGPAGVAVNQSGAGGAGVGDIYVADRGNNRIERFAADGTFISAWGFDVIQAGKPGDLGTNVFEICAVAADCKAGIASITPALGGELSSPYGIAIDQASGNLYVTNQLFRRVEVFSATGSFVRAFGKDVIQSGKPGDVGVNVFEVCTVAADCQIGSATAPTSGGEFSSTVAGPQPAVAPAGAPNAGNVIVPDPGNRRIQEFTTSGAFVRLWGWDVIPTGKPGDLGANVFEVCTSTATGNCQAGQTTAPGNNPGQFATNTPTRVAEDSSGAIYAVEPTTNFRVQRFTLPGNVVTPQGAFAPATVSGTTSTGAAANNPTDVAVGAADHVFVVKVFPAGAGTPPAPAQERRVLELDPSGALLDTHMAAAGINSVNDLAANPANGRLFVPSGTTSEQRVYVLADPPDRPPLVVTGAAGAGADFSLRMLEGTVNPEGFKVSDCHFEYGTTTAYGTSTPCEPSVNALGEGTSDVAVSASTEPLEPNTTYHYRLLASNSALAAEGEDRTFTTGDAPADSCPNAARRAEQGIEAILLPDCMALEMVSPPQKGGQPAKSPTVSTDGERILFRSAAGLAGNPTNLPIEGEPYVASRTGSDWQTVFTGQAGIYKGWSSFGEAQSFTPDLSRWFRVGATPEQWHVGKGQAFSGAIGVPPISFSPLLEPVGGGEPGDIDKSRLQGASADHSHLYFVPGRTSTAYRPGDPAPSGAAADGNTYVATLDANGNPKLDLLAFDRLGKFWGNGCGTRIGGIGGEGVGARNQGAISPDGSRVYFSSRPSQPVGSECSASSKLRILERLESQQGPWIGELIASECNRVEPEPCSSVDGDDFYQGASADGTKVYFTTNRQLANSDRDANGTSCTASLATTTSCDLYLYDAALPSGQRLIQVSAGEVATGHPIAGAGAEVLNGITGISGNGSHVYFVANGVLTTDTSPKGLSAALGQPNLYSWDRASEAIAFIGTLAPGDAANGTANDEQGLWGGAGSFRNLAYPVPVLREDGNGNEVGGDGHVLVFESKAPLSSDDGDGSFRDVFRYHTGSQLIERLSKPVPPIADNGAFDVGGRGPVAPPGTDFAEQSRWVSEDGNAIVFRTAEKLIPGDVNRAVDSYLWADGQLTRLPGTVDTSGTLRDRAVLSHDGSLVAFQTYQQLLPQDGDSAIDVYVARVGGGFAPAPPGPPNCDPPCTPAPPTSPAAPSSDASEAVVPVVPPPPSKPKPCPRGKRKVNRDDKVRCVRRKSHRKHQRHARSRNANAQRRAGK
ncbi:MAG TPA: NHL repeat-containing protein [Solirubrobacterales bacterium]|nr:NHL repeat-containing protein [Solirubrobacterales bacterium]